MDLPNGKSDKTAMKKLVYIVSAMHYPNGMAKILTDKLNWLAENTNYDLYMVETERADLPHYYELNKRVHCINFDINFDGLYSLPTIKRAIAYKRKTAQFKKELTKYLLDIKPTITISTLRREINFINDIKDGSKKIGEIHFCRSQYRVYNNKKLPNWINKIITRQWQKSLIKQISRLDRFVVLTKADATEWKEFSTLSIIPNFIKDIPKENSTCNPKNIISLGRYSHEKGFDILIEAWKYIEPKHPEWKLDIYGSGDNARYQAIANNYKLKNITCNNAIKDVNQAYLNSSIYVLSSRHEGFGLVLIEAMACGVPCVSFDCPCGPKDIIQDGYNGLLANKEDPKSLANKILSLIENENTRKEYGKNAKKSVEYYTIENIMPKWVELFESL